MRAFIIRRCVAAVGDVKMARKPLDRAIPSRRSVLLGALAASGAALGMGVTRAPCGGVGVVAAAAGAAGAPA